MTIDVAGILYGPTSPVFGALAVDATFVKGAINATIRVIDDTQRWIELEGTAEVQTIAPGAFARKVELDGAGITRDDYVDAMLTFNGQAWRITSFEMVGSPQGENAGEVRFILAQS
jgi:hypothetical protein